MIYNAYDERTTKGVIMDFNVPAPGVEAYRLGQFHGVVAGVIASAAAYYLFKAYKPNNPFKVTKIKEDPEL
jgi:hypothetical protein